MAGFSWASALEPVAQDYPEIDFTIIDMVVDQPNVRSIVFKEQEGSYLVGMLAGMKSESGTVGFVGGMEIPLIGKFECGYVGGVMAADEERHRDPQLHRRYAGRLERSDPRRRDHPFADRAGRRTSSITRGGGPAAPAWACCRQPPMRAPSASASTPTRTTCIRAPVLTSMMKRVDVAVYQASWMPIMTSSPTASRISDLAEDGVGYALDEHNEELITAEMREAVEAAKAAIIAGEIEVHDFSTDNTCPY